MADGKKKRGRGAPLSDSDKAKRAKEKRERFIKVCGLRMDKALKAIGLVANCSSNSYIYTEEDVKRINAAFSKAVGECLNSFRPKDAANSEKPSFSFQE